MNAIMKANLIQCKALKMLNPDNNSALDIEMIYTFGADWRLIINQFLVSKGRVPTEDDLIWCSSLDEHLGQDIRLIVEELKANLKK